MRDPAAFTPFRRAVLALNGEPTDELVVRFACEVARSHKAQLIAIHVVEVDWRHDLSEDVSSGNVEASAILDRAEAIAEKYRVGIETELLQARDVGAALVDEATAMEADTIILGLAYRMKFGGDFAVGRTVPYVLRNAPGGVIVLREPIASSEARGGERQTMIGVGMGEADRL